MNEKQQQLVLAALKSTDSYLGVLKDAEKKGGSEMHIHDFTQHYTNAHNALTALNKINQHEPYMKEHVGDMIKVANDEDTSLADEPYAHALKGAGEEMDEDFGGERSYTNTTDYIINPRTGRKQRAGKIYFYTETDPEKEAEKAKRKREIEKNKQMDAGQQVTEINNFLENKSKLSGIPVDVLFEVYSRAFDEGIDPELRVNSFIVKGKAYHADKDLQEKRIIISDSDMDKMVEDLKWEDIEDIFKENVEELDEAISATTRIKKGQQLKRRTPRLGQQKDIKLARSADLDTLKNRAKIAARRAIMKSLLKGRKKHQLSAQEKDRLEQQIRNMKTVVNTLSIKMLPKVRDLQSKRLSGKGKK